MKRTHSMEEVLDAVEYIDAMRDSSNTQTLAGFLSDYVRTAEANKLLLAGLKDLGRYDDQEVQSGLFDPK